MDEKHVKSQSLRQSRLKYVESVENRIKTYSERSELNLLQLKTERKIAVVKSLLTLRRENMIAKSAKLDSAKKQIEEKRRILINVRKSYGVLEKLSDGVEKTLQKRRELLEKRRKHLTLVRQQTATDLFRNIFSLDTVTISSDTTKSSTSTSLSDQSLSIEVVDALSEATLTNYCHDRWIFMGRQAEIQYRLVHSCTIGDYCDYIPLTGWLFR